MKPKVFIVIPTIRSLSFLTEWKDAFKETNLIIVEDHKTQEIAAPNKGFQAIYHYTWENIKKDFGKDEWIFSRKNAGIRSYGFWKSYTLSADIIITLDDDCYPAEEGFIEKHIDNLSASSPNKWTTTYPYPEFMFTRGIPRSVRNKNTTVISHGLWTNKIDLDAQTELHNPNLNLPLYPPFRQFIPKGVYFPMCSMNLAFSRQATPLMYFPLMGFNPDGNPWGFDRFDDIWAGIIAKKICDHLGLSIVNGSPFVEHRKASNLHNNLEKEKAGLEVNEYLWENIDAVRLTKNTVAGCYSELTNKVVFPKNSYFIRLRQAMGLWIRLFAV